MRVAFAEAGYGLAHAGTATGTENSLIEVYPHPAFLALLDETYRVPYKVGKSGRLWKGADVAGVDERKANLLHSFDRILDRLRDEVAHIL